MSCRPSGAVAGGGGIQGAAIALFLLNRKIFEKFSFCRKILVEKIQNLMLKHFWENLKTNLKL